MNRLAFLAIPLFIFAAGCGSKTPTTPSTTNPNQVKFTAAVLPSNEVPAITDAESTGRGTVNITFNLTRDAAGAITAVNADFALDVNGFPAGTPITAAHIHQGVSGANGGILV